MKIALIGNDYVQQFPLIDYGGIESCVENLAIGLHSNKLDFSIIVPKRKTIAQYDFDIIETHEAPTKLSGKTATDYCKNVKEILKDLAPDVIWSQSHWSADGLHDLGIPIICTFHDSCEKQHNWIRPYKNIVYRFISKFQYNNWIQNETEQRHSVQCYTGIADEEYIFFDKNQSQDYYLWCAGLQWGFEAKGLNIFLKLAQDNPNHLFMAYGSGDNDMSQILSQQQDIKNFQFLGSLPRGPLHKKVFGEAKAFIIPTQIPDTFPRTCLESISKGTPIIGSSYGSIPEIIENNNCGIVCNSIDDYNIAISTIDRFDRQSIYNHSMQYSINNEIQTLLLNSYNLCQQIKP